MTYQIVQRHATHALELPQWKANLTNLPSEITTKIFSHLFENKDSKGFISLCLTHRSFYEIIRKDLFKIFQDKFNSNSEMSINQFELIGLAKFAAGFFKLTLKDNGLNCDRKFLIDSTTLWENLENQIKFATRTSTTKNTIITPYDSSKFTQWITDNKQSLEKITELTLLQIAFLPNIDFLTGLQKLTIYSSPSFFPITTCSMTSLKTLDLVHGNYPSIPSEIKQLTNLMKLHLSKTCFREINPEIYNLTNLTDLCISENSNLQTVSSEIGNLSNLESLHIMDTSIEILPSEIGKLINLSKLRIKNKLKKVPSEIGNLTKLNVLLIKENFIKTLPTEIGKLINLKELYLDNKMLETFPSEMGNLENLTSLSLGCNYNKSLPTEISKLYNLHITRY